MTISNQSKTTGIRNTDIHRIRWTRFFSLQGAQHLAILRRIVQESAYFQKSRYYGLHAVANARKLMDKIPHQLKRSGKSIQSRFEILHHLLK